MIFLDTHTVEDILEKIEKEMPFIPDRTDEPATQRDVRVAFDTLHTAIAQILYALEEK